ncbi:ribonuclease H-like domain-containing protein, partial [Tanacetum coccineum]
QEGIKRQFTTAYTPQQNGVAERMNITLLERARAMLATTSLGKSFSAEAVNTPCYVINRSPLTNVELKTPMEIKYLFLGYADGVKRYRLWDPTAHKVVVSRDVVFMEDKIQENEEGDSTTRENTSIPMEKKFSRMILLKLHLSTRVALRLCYDASFWKKAMQEEIKPLYKNKTWELVPLPGGRKPIGNKWAYKIKKNGDDQVESSGKFNVRDDLYKTRHCTCSGSSESVPGGTCRSIGKLVKRILRYIKGTSDVALCFGESDLIVKGYVDSDYAGDLEGSKSTTRYVFTLCGGTISWVSKLQAVVAMSTTKVEYVAAAQASKEAVWLKMFLEEPGHNKRKLLYFVIIKVPCILQGIQHFIQRQSIYEFSITSTRLKNQVEMTFRSLFTFVSLGIKRRVNGKRKISELLRTRAMGDYRFGDGLADSEHYMALSWGCLVGRMVDSGLRVLKVGSLRIQGSSMWLLNAFLNGDLSETVYMYQPPGFVDVRFPHHVCRLQRSLYGLKQAPRVWFQRFAGYALRVGFSSSRCDSSLFIYRCGTEVAYLLIYVDDIVLTASSTNLLQRIISSLHKEFDMTDLGALIYFLGISVTRDSKSMFLSQKKYALQLLDMAHMANCGLQYLTFTRPDISYAVQHVCLHMHDPREPHFAALKRILRYVRGTLDFGLQLYTSSTGSLVAYSDADWAGCPTTRRSTSGYCVFLGDNLLSWSSKRQHTLSRSSVEAEYRGVSNAVAETAWLRNLLRELHTPLLSATLVYCDNVSAVYLTANPVQHQRTKHIEIDIHFVRDMVARGQVRVLHVPSSRYQYADIFTKGLYLRSFVPV